MKNFGSLYFKNIYKDREILLTVLLSIVIVTVMEVNVYWFSNINFFGLLENLVIVLLIAIVYVLIDSFIKTIKTFGIFL